MTTDIQYDRAFGYGMLMLRTARAMKSLKSMPSLILPRLTPKKMAPVSLLEATPCRLLSSG